MGRDWTPYPESTAADYRRAGHWQGRTLGERFRECARRYPDALAVVAGAARLTYAELDNRCDRLANGLVALGVTARDRVVVQLPNGVEFVEVLFALMRVGATPVLVMPAYRRQELRALMQIAEPAAYVVPDHYGGFDFRTQARELCVDVGTVRHVVVAGEPAEFTPVRELYHGPEPRPDVDADDLALCVMSGGTTGGPKLVPRTHENYAYLPNACAAAGLDRDDIYLAALPLAHNFPLACPGLLGTLTSGGTAVMSPTSSPDDAFPLIERARVTWTTLVPSVVEFWTEATRWHRSDLSSLRLVQVGGSVFRPESARRATQRLDCGLQQVYGMAEGLLTMTALDDPDDLVLTTQGRPPCPADEVRLVDPDGVDVEAGGVGELWTRGPYTVRGYFRAPESSAGSFTPDGLYRTGDLARRLPSGHLVIEGRLKDVINRGGDKIPCAELEGHLVAHPAISAAAAVPVPDSELGERVCVFLVCERPRSLREIRAFLQARGVASFKFPDRIEYVDRLPLTKIGKIDRKALMARIAGPAAGS
ncbi:(2,3-dihydroxybenzoyl)adenylate synthase [Rhizomonospora bruguierae]|uniref:(2,3-dihydroxybenzoyl)adenylate synthase n=1 Tax=Rhizomonospora bruguierae TaxID=1581705 RepID=UPI001BD1AA5F|nr:AMP-binding protein [Micromonospora sp. NBRC 107566]